MSNLFGLKGKIFGQPSEEKRFKQPDKKDKAHQLIYWGVHPPKKIRWGEGLHHYSKVSLCCAKGTSAMLPTYHPSHSMQGLSYRAAAVNTADNLFPKITQTCHDLKTQEPLWKYLLMWMFSCFLKKKEEIHDRKKRKVQENLEQKTWRKWTFCKPLS